MSLNIRPWNFQHLRNQQNQGRYPYSTHLEILIENVTEKSYNSLFQRERETY